MAGNIKATCMLFIAVVLTVAVVRRSEAAIGCGDVISYLQSCIPYVFSNGPIGGCCGGIMSLNSAAKTTADRQAVCSCLKNLLSQNPGVNAAKAAGLPAKCGVNVPFKISPTTDCSKVS